MFNIASAGGAGANRRKNAFPPGSSGGKRIEILDLWRSVCVWMMLVYHALYDLSLFGVLPGSLATHPLARVYCYLGAGGFVLLSGICVRFSRDPLRRGFFVFCCGILVTAATTLAGYPVTFGVLSLLGCAMLLYGAAKKRIEPLLGPAFAAVCLALFAGTWILTALVRVPFPYLYPLGFRTETFYSADYFPLLPWLFLFLLGCCLGKGLEGVPLGNRRFPKALTLCGRHSLLIYLLHQPLFYGLCLLMAGQKLR